MKLLRTACAVLSAHLVVLAGLAAAQSVHVVDPAGGGDFTSLQAAVDAAADGDAIIVVAAQPVTLIDNAVEIVDKGVVIMGIDSASGFQPRFGRFAVLGLSAGKSVIVRNIRVQSSGTFTPFELTGCAGAVLFEDCSGTAGSGSFGTIPQFVIQQSSHVVLTRCDFDGANGAPGAVQSTTGGPGLVVEESTVAIYDSTITGGFGIYAQFIGDFLLNVATEGGQGLQIWSGNVFVSGSAIRGGNGGGGAQSASGTSCSPPKKGGAGLRTYGHLTRLDSTIEGGEPGFVPACASPANPGADIVLQDDGSVSEVPELSRELVISSPVESNGSCNVAIHGQPGDNVVLLQSLVGFGQLHAGLKGALAGQPPYFTILLGAIGPNGNLVFNVHLPPGPLPAGIEAVTLIEQVLTGADSGGGLLSSPSVITIVDNLP